jgi:putative glycosyltransferase
LSPVKLSIVPTLYCCSEPFTGEFHACPSPAAEAVFGNDYEILLLNGGSHDGNLNLAVALARDDPPVTIVDLSYSLGPQKSIRASIWLLGRTVMSFIGVVVGVYLSRVYSETK